MSVNNVPVQAGGVAVLGAAGARAATSAVSRAFGHLPETGGAILDHARGLLIGGAGVLTVGAALVRGGRTLRLKSGDTLD